MRTKEVLNEALASSKPTPLDALTAYGKREAIRQMQWSGNGLVGFGTAPLIRELNHEQLAAVLRFLDAENYLPMLEKKLVGPPLRLSPPFAQVEQDLQSLRKFADADNTRRAEVTAPATETGAPAVLRRYQELFGARLNPATLTIQPLGDLLPLFDAASLAATGNPASPALDDMLRVHREFTARGIDTRRTLDDSMLYAMLAARRFEQAGAFVSIRPHIADLPIPQVVDPLGPSFKGRSVFAYDAVRNSLTRISLPLQSGKELVMVVGAGCHNSTNALQAVHDDAALQARLHGVNVVLVTAPSAPIETQLITEWNAANPTMPIRVPYSGQEWQAIEVTGIPSFYLLSKGKVVDRRIGWPAEGKAELAKLIDAATK
ncbi:hypothetical protein [Massilia sp. CCM 8734]|uniref:hypothetical protein n=1 Tax=Massilia sp. CCM 8734 TaxID=2609283 RepID=UPI0014234976|nr:hypothetical protein [Massilia sp. CCM 8734]NHZ96416.1 hypothetical protein [Massilia sp. CCM 8734]